MCGGFGDHAHSAIGPGSVRGSAKPEQLLSVGIEGPG